MLNSLKIENYRGFQSFELHQLGRINLLVGENNSGKTSILEAIQLLHSRSNLEPLKQSMISRGEALLDEDRKRASGREDFELDVRHLFYSHEMDLESRFTISGESKDAQSAVTSSIVAHELSAAEQVNIEFMADDSELRGFDFTITWISNNDHQRVQFPLLPNGGLLAGNAWRFRHLAPLPAVQTLFVTSASLTIDAMVSLFDQVVLKPEEETIIHALQSIDPAIDRVASVGSQRYRPGTRGGFIVRRSEDEQPVPIGSMGDGIWRMLGLSLAAACTKGGILLVDEIDTGLHFTTMSKMWKMIWETAKQSNVQVFATTHSDDCVRSLAELAEAENVAENEITIHRIERNKPRSVVFDAEMAVIAANQGIEVR